MVPVYMGSVGEVICTQELGEWLVSIHTVFVMVMRSWYHSVEMHAGKSQLATLHEWCDRRDILAWTVYTFFLFNTHRSLFLIHSINIWFSLRLYYLSQWNYSCSWERHRLPCGTFVSWWFLPQVWSPVTDVQRHYLARYPYDDWQYHIHQLRSWPGPCIHVSTCKWVEWYLAMHFS